MFARPGNIQERNWRSFPARRPRSATLLLGLFVFAIHSASPTPQSGDSRLSAIVAWRFFGHFDLHLESYRVVTGLTDHNDLLEHSGHLLPFFPWPTMLLAEPFDLLAALFGHDPTNLSISDPSRVWLVEVPTASLMIAVTAVLLRQIVLDAGVTRRTALVVALVFAFGTSAWSVGSRALWQQTASMLFIAIAILAAQRIGGRRLLWGCLLGASLAVALICRPTNAVVVVAAAGYLLAVNRRAILPALLGGIPVIAVFLVVSMIQYGQAFPPYYLPSRLGEGGGLPFWETLAMNLVSPSRGLLLYDPVALLAVAGLVITFRRTGHIRAWQTIAALTCVAHLVVISMYGSTGGSTYGPRLLIDVLPLLMLLAVPTLSLLGPDRAQPTRHRGSAVVLIVVCLLWGFFVNATGGLLRAGYCWSATPVQVDAQPSRVWDWADPQFLRPYRDLVTGASLVHVIAGSCTR